MFYDEEKAANPTKKSENAKKRRLHYKQKLEKEKEAKRVRECKDQVTAGINCISKQDPSVGSGKFQIPKLILCAY